MSDLGIGWRPHSALPQGPERPRRSSVFILPLAPPANVEQPCPEALRPRRPGWQAVAPAKTAVSARGLSAPPTVSTSPRAAACATWSPAAARAKGFLLCAAPAKSGSVSPAAAAAALLSTVMGEPGWSKVANGTF